MMDSTMSQSGNLTLEALIFFLKTLESRAVQGISSLKNEMYCFIRTLTDFYIIMLMSNQNEYNSS